MVVEGEDPTVSDLPLVLGLGARVQDPCADVVFGAPNVESRGKGPYAHCLRILVPTPPIQHVHQDV